MLKRFVWSIILVIVLMISTTVAYAKTSSISLSENIELPANLLENIVPSVKVINQNTGEVYSLNPKIVEFRKDEAGNTMITYEVGVPTIMFTNELANENYKNYFRPSIVLADSKSWDSCDSTSSACANLSFYYTDLGDHMYSSYSQVIWTKQDSQVTFVQGRLGVRCLADWYPSGGVCSIDSYTTVSPVSGTVYTKTPTFAGSQTYKNDFMGQMAYQILNLRRGATNWEFYTCVQVGGGLMSWECQ